jgi:hypothetical protein
MVLRPFLAPTDYAVAVLLLMMVSCPAGGAAQVAIGGHLSRTEFLEEEATWGYGARALVQIPGMGLGVQGTYDRYGEDCPGGNCDLTEVGANLVWTFPLPIVIHPYVGGGVVFETLEGSGVEVDTDNYRVQVLGGLVLSGPSFRRFRPFGEVRYELEEKRTSFSGGILLYLF